MAYAWTSSPPQNNTNQVEHDHTQKNIRGPQPSHQTNTLTDCFLSACVVPGSDEPRIGKSESEQCATKMREPRAAQDIKARSTAILKPILL